MSGQDLHMFASKSSGGTGGITRPSKLPLFGRRSSEKHPPPTFQPPVSTAFVASPLGGVRPSTVVKPYFAAHYQPNTNNDSQRRRHPSSQPGTPIRSGQHEVDQDHQQIHRSAHFLHPSGASGSSSPSKRNESSGVIPQSISFPGSRHALQNPQQPEPSSPKSKAYPMENMSVEHLQYLERRLQKLLEVIPPCNSKAKSDSGQQSAHPAWMAISSQGHGLRQSQQAMHQYPMIASPFNYHPQTAPLLLFPPQQPTGPSPNAIGGAAVFGELDPYYNISSATKSASSHYGSNAPSSLQDFNRDELCCLLHVVRNMLSMHQQNHSCNASKSSSLALDPLAALKHRPFSWYLHKTARTPSSPTSSTVNLFLDDSDSMNAEAMDDSVITGIDDGGGDDGDQRPKTSSESGSHPPLLPAGFRNFTRYLDSKFGPDSNQEQRSRRHHHHQREPIENNSHVEATITTGSSASNRARSVTDAKPKISITPCASDTAFPIPDIESSHQSNGNSPGLASSGAEETELAQRLAATWCAPYWCPPPLPPNAAWYQQVTAPPPLPPVPPPLHPPPPPPPPSQVRYFAPPHPPPNAAAACWFRAAANHFATAAAIFAADNAAAASAMATPHQIQLPPVPRPPAHGGVRIRRGPPAVCPSEFYPRITPVTSALSHLEPGLYSHGQHPTVSGDEDEDDFFVVSDGENQQHQPIRRRQCRFPAMEPLQRQLWGRRVDDIESPVGGSSGSQTIDDVERGLDMLPQDPALILPDQVDFYAQIKDLLELDRNISLPLPAGWAVGVSSSGRRFYVSCRNGDTGGSGGNGGSRNRTRTTTWQHPVIAPRIPLGWERVEMRRGNCVYYRHLLIPHTQRHHPDLWFPTSLKNVEFEQQSWFFDLRKLQESVSNFDIGNSQLIESYVDTRDPSEEARFAELLKRYGVGELENLLKHLDCRFFRDLHRMVVAFEIARIRIVRELFVQHIHRTNASATEVVSSHSAPESAINSSQSV